MGEGVDNFRFIVVEFEEVILHPGFNVSKAGVSGGSDGLGEEVELGVVGATVEPQAVAAENVAEGEDIQDAEGTKH